jgi:uncharacterized protein (DUF1330 family)
MSAYLIAMVRVDDPETYRKYTARTPEIIKRHGGKFLVRGGEVEAIEGEPFRDRLVLLEFPSKEHVKSFYTSPEYRDIMKYRHDSSDSRFLLAEGVSGDGSAPADRVEKSG